MTLAIDFYCDTCGVVEVDCIMKNSEEIAICSTCNNPMKRMFTRISYSTKHKDHEYPTHSLGSGEKARFGNKPNFS